MDTDGTIGDSLAADYRIRERILAAYVMTTVKFGDFTAIPGVRVENTKSKYAAKAVIDTLVLDDIDKDYDNFGAQSYTRSEEHTSELQSLMRISYAVFCLK